MARPRKDGTVKPSNKHDYDNKKELLDIILREVKINDYSLKDICEKLGISVYTFYSWLKQPDFKDYNKLYQQSKIIGDFNDNREILSSAKSALRKKIEGYEYEETTKQYRIENGKRKLVGEYIKKKTVQPEMGEIKFTLEHLSNVYKEEKLNNVMELFMAFNTYISEKNPSLASSLVIYQNNFLAEQIKDIKEIPENNS